MCNNVRESGHIYCALPFVQPKPEIVIFASWPRLKRDPVEASPAGPPARGGGGARFVRQTFLVGKSAGS